MAFEFTGGEAGIGRDVLALQCGDGKKDSKSEVTTYRDIQAVIRP